jgi:hypothetical protein
MVLCTVELDQFKQTCEFGMGVSLVTRMAPASSKGVRKRNHHSEKKKEYKEETN